MDNPGVGFIFLSFFLRLSAFICGYLLLFEQL